MFLIKWKNSEKSDYVPSEQAKKKYPQTVIQYYEEHLIWESADSNSAVNKTATDVGIGSFEKAKNKLQLLFLRKSVIFDSICRLFVAISNVPMSSITFIFTENFFLVPNIVQQTVNQIKYVLQEKSLVNKKKFFP